MREGIGTGNASHEFGASHGCSGCSASRSAVGSPASTGVEAEPHTARRENEEPATGRGTGAQKRRQARRLAVRAFVGVDKGQCQSITAL